MLHSNRENNEDSGLSPEQKSKIINIPEGTEITDSQNKKYKIKPKFGLRILDEVEGACNVVIDDSISLSDAVEFVEHGVEDQPDVDEVLVMDGKFID